ncbi:putative naringenin 3-dioxygenase [Diaporthe ampelina]|uniref:Putative naringenin 3-dioxygenase n=1 Tax=Diaporthe ampelina TaxID=1214573 RepID=A0A0G2FL78_9PEZI|nr:putative naringenin 3-dioxygenase [Diaporthe ampelina]
MSFKSIPVLDLALADDPATKPAFLIDLRDALMEVGFLYIKNVGISDELFEKVISLGRAFFDIPLEEKLKIEMKNAPSFLGYSRLSAEITAGQIDHREQIDLSTEHPVPGPDAPRHHNLLAPNQWPSEDVLPGFRATYAEYMRLMAGVSVRFTSLVAEAVGLPPHAFDKYVGAPDQQHKLKIVRYPDAGELGLGGGEDSSARQGVGPHKDSMLTSYLLQASGHRGLQAQNTRGEWIDCPPREGTLVVAIGQGMEALTRGVCTSTTHRVLSPWAGEGPRFSVPFFQGVAADTTFEDLEGTGVGAVPQEVRQLREAVLAANGGRRLDDVEFTFRGGGVARTLGEATLRNRVKSHPDVGERWYPDILAQIREEQARASQPSPPSQPVPVGGEGRDPQATAVTAH